MTLTWNGDELFDRLKQAIFRGVFIGAEIVRESAVTSITQGSKTGEIYDTRFFTIGRGAGRTIIPYDSRPPHKASAPDEAPASDTGRLANSGRVILDQVNTSAIVNFSARHAAFLEFGTDKIAARPFLRPALNGNKERIIEAIADEVRAVIR